MGPSSRNSSGEHVSIPIINENKIKALLAEGGGGIRGEETEGGKEERKKSGELSERKVVIRWILENVNAQ